MSTVKRVNAVVVTMALIVMSATIFFALCMTLWKDGLEEFGVGHTTWLITDCNRTGGHWFSNNTMYYCSY